MIGRLSRSAGCHLVAFLKRDLWKFAAAYVLLLGVLAYLGRWTPDYLEGRDL